MKIAILTLVSLFATSGLAQSSIGIKAKATKLEVRFETANKDGSVPDLSQAKSAVGIGACVADVIEQTYGAAIAIMDERDKVKDYYNARIFNAIAFGLLEKSGTIKNSLRKTLENGGILQCAEDAARFACLDYGFEAEQNYRNAFYQITPGIQVLTIDTSKLTFQGVAVAAYSQVKCQKN